MTENGARPEFWFTFMLLQKGSGISRVISVGTDLIYKTYSREN